MSSWHRRLLLWFFNQISDHVFCFSQTRRLWKEQKSKENIYRRKVFVVRTCTSMFGQMFTEPKMKGNVGCGSCLCEPVAPHTLLIRPAWSSQVPITYQERSVLLQVLQLPAFPRLDNAETIMKQDKGRAIASPCEAVQVWNKAWSFGREGSSQYLD